MLNPRPRAMPLICTPLQFFTDNGGCRQHFRAFAHSYKSTAQQRLRLPFLCSNSWRIVDIAEAAFGQTDFAQGQSGARSCVTVVVAVDVEAKKGPTWRGLVPVEVLSSERLGVRGAWAVLEPNSNCVAVLPRFTAWRLRYPTISCRSLWPTATNLLENRPS